MLCVCEARIVLATVGSCCITAGGVLADPRVVRMRFRLSRNLHARVSQKIEGPAALALALELSSMACACSTFPIPRWVAVTRRCSAARYLSSLFCGVVPVTEDVLFEPECRAGSCVEG